MNKKSKIPAAANVEENKKEKYFSTLMFYLFNK